MQQILNPTQEHNVCTAQVEKCAFSPNVTKHPVKTERTISSELLNTLRRECLEREVLARVARLPNMIDPKRLSVKLDPRQPFYEELKLESPKCNYVLSENYENLSGDESPAVRSFGANDVDRKAIQPFLSLVDSMEEKECSSKTPLREEEDDIPHEGSLVIDDRKSSEDPPPLDDGDRRSSSPQPRSPEESETPPRKDCTGAAHKESKEDSMNESKNRGKPTLKEQKTRRPKPGNLKKATAAAAAAAAAATAAGAAATGATAAASSDVEKNSDCGNSVAECPGATNPGRGSFTSPTRRYKRRNTKPVGKSNGEDSAGKDCFSASSGGGEAANGKPVRNGQRRRARWKSGPGADKGGEDSSDSNNTVDYELSSDEDVTKGDKPSTEEQQPAVKPGPKKPRKSIEEGAKSAGNEPLNDESRYKRLAQELPGFNWLEQKIMGHSAPPALKAVAPKTAPPPTEKTEPASAPIVYPPGTDILSRSMSEIQDDCVDEERCDTAPSPDTSTRVPMSEASKNAGNENTPPSDLAQRSIPCEEVASTDTPSYSTASLVSRDVTYTGNAQGGVCYALNLSPSQAPKSEKPLSASSASVESSVARRPSPKGMIDTGKSSPSIIVAPATPSKNNVSDDKTNDSDVLYLGVVQKGSANKPEEAEERRPPLLSVGRPAETKRPPDPNGEPRAPDIPRPSAPGPVNPNDTSRREAYVERHTAAPYLVPHMFLTPRDHQRWMEERRYERAMAAAPVPQQPNTLPRPSFSPEQVAQHVGNLPEYPYLFPGRYDSTTRYRAQIPGRSVLRLQQQLPNLNREDQGAEGRLDQYQLQQRPDQPHTQHRSDPVQEHLRNEQLQAHHRMAQLQGQHAAKQLQEQRIEQIQEQHRVEQLQGQHRAEQLQNQRRLEQLQGQLHAEQQKRQLRIEQQSHQRTEQLQGQHRRMVEQAIGTPQQAQQNQGYFGMPSGGTVVEAPPKSVTSVGMNTFTKNMSIVEQQQKENASAGSYRSVSGTENRHQLQNADVASNPALIPCPDGSPMGNYSGNLKAEMELRKEELRYLDILASQKEAEYENVVHMRTEKLRILTQLESRYRKATEQQQHLSKEDKMPALDAGPSSANQKENGTARARDDVKGTVEGVRQMAGPDTGSVQRKTTSPGRRPTIPKSSSTQQSAPALIPYSVPMSQQRTGNPLVHQANIPMSVPLIGTGLFNVRSLDFPRDLAPVVMQSQSASTLPEQSRMYYQGDRGKPAPPPLAEQLKPPAKRKLSQTEMEQHRTQDRTGGSGGAQIPPYPHPNFPHVDLTKGAPMFHPQHPYWAQVACREPLGRPSNLDAYAASAFQTYHGTANKQMPPERVPLPPNLPNVAWGSYAEALQERYSHKMAKQGLCRTAPGCPENLDKQRADELQAALAANRDQAQKMCAREEIVLHKAEKARPGVRPLQIPMTMQGIGKHQPPLHTAQGPQPVVPTVPGAPAAKYNTCGFCGQHARYMCSGCQNIWYCGAQCQRSNWVNHAQVCGGPST